MGGGEGGMRLKEMFSWQYTLYRHTGIKPRLFPVGGWGGGGGGGGGVGGG